MEPLTIIIIALCALAIGGLPLWIRLLNQSKVNDHFSLRGDFHYKIKNGSKSLKIIKIPTEILNEPNWGLVSILSDGSEHPVFVHNCDMDYNFYWTECTHTDKKKIEKSKSSLEYVWVFE